MKEWIYVLSNSGIPGMVKIGHCEAPPEDLVRSLDMSGASPFPYRIEYKVCLKNDGLHIQQNIRKALWANLKNVGCCWYSITGQEAIEIIRGEIALFLIDKLRIEIRGNYGTEDFTTVMRVVDKVLVLKGNIDLETTVVTFEAREIAKIIADIMKNQNWRQDGLWLNRITGGNSRYSLNQHCLTR